MLEKEVDLSFDSHGQCEFEVTWRNLQQNQQISENQKIKNITKLDLWKG